VPQVPVHSSHAEFERLQGCSLHCHCSQQHHSNDAIASQETRDTWGLLAHGLSGIFCGSLNFLDSAEHIAQPLFTFGSGAQLGRGGCACPCRAFEALQCRPGGHGLHATIAHSYQAAPYLQVGHLVLQPSRACDCCISALTECSWTADGFERRPGWTYGALPREAVCTENLTPWLRQLPCREAAGLAALLHGPTVFSSPFTSLTASLTAAPDGAGGTSLRLVQTLTLLLSHRAGANEDPESQSKGWSLTGLFGAEAGGACPLASRSTVHVQLPWDAPRQPGSGRTADAQQAARQLGVTPAPAAVSLQAGAAIMMYPLPAGPGAAPLRISQRHGLSQGSRAVGGQPALAVHRCREKQLPTASTPCPASRCPCAVWETARP